MADHASNAFPKHLNMFVTPILLGFLMFVTFVTSQLGLPDDVASMLHNDTRSINETSTDWGHIVHRFSAAVLDPNSTDDIATLLQFANNGSTRFGIAPRGQGHSARGQPLTKGGVVINMTSLNSLGSRVVVNKLGTYADVGGEQLWIDVLRATLKRGLTPLSWTDYLYLSVGGTLSNAGISGQTFRYGPQITNVLELDVVTGKGNLITCSSNRTPELFYGALGGLGQFGVITRARIALKSAPTRVKWIRLIYTDFSKFSKDQEHMISSSGRKGDGFDYVEGFIHMEQGPLDISYYPVEDRPRIISLLSQYGIIYAIEVAKYYDDTALRTIDKVIATLFYGLGYVDGFQFEREVTYLDFLNRVRPEEEILRQLGLWEVAHPWLNLFVPRSRISDFDLGVFKGILLKQKVPSGLIIVYPMNRKKWDTSMSAVVPEENVFYVVGLLHASGFDTWQELDAVNTQILQFCNSSGILAKQYLPHYETQQDWAGHFGFKWQSFQDLKIKYDPNKILAPGQMVFNDL